MLQLLQICSEGAHDPMHFRRGPHGVSSRPTPAQARMAEYDWLILRCGLSAFSSDRVNPNVSSLLLARQLLPGQHMPVTHFFATPPSSRLWMPMMAGRKKLFVPADRYLQADISHERERLSTAQNRPTCTECCASREACSPAA